MQDYLSLYLKNYSVINLSQPNLKGKKSTSSFRNIFQVKNTHYQSHLEKKQQNKYMIKHSLRVKHLNLTLITKKYDKKHYLGTNNSLRKNMYDFTIRWLYKK